MSNPKDFPACVHFRKKGHNFIQHAKFILIEQITETENVSKATLKFRLKLSEDFWLLKLDTLSPKAVNQGLNNVYSPTASFTVHILLVYYS